VTLAIALRFIDVGPGQRLTQDGSSVVKQFQALVDEMEARLAEEEGTHSSAKGRRPKTAV
jgi:hypothetical protein